MMAKEILMQKGTALWLAKRTKLTNAQIAEFCNMHEIEVNAFRMELHANVIEVNPVDTFLLSDEIIKKCEDDPKCKLESNQLEAQSKVRKTRNYAKKHEIVNAVFWILNKYPNIPDEKVAKLFKCTKNLVNAIREKKYKEYENLVPRHPVVLDLCTQEDLDKLLIKYE